MLNTAWVARGARRACAIGFAPRASSRHRQGPGAAPLIQTPPFAAGAKPPQLRDSDRSSSHVFSSRVNRPLKGRAPGPGANRDFFAILCFGLYTPHFFDSVPATGYLARLYPSPLSSALGGRLRGAVTERVVFVDACAPVPRARGLRGRRLAAVPSPACCPVSCRSTSLRLSGLATFSRISRKALLYRWSWRSSDPDFLGVGEQHRSLP